MIWLSDGNGEILMGAYLINNFTGIDSIMAKPYLLQKSLIQLICSKFFGSSLGHDHFWPLRLLMLLEAKKPLEAKKGLESKDFWGHQYQLLYSSNLTNDKITFGMASVPSVTLTWKPLYKSLMTETFYFQTLTFRVLELRPKVLISSEVKKFYSWLKRKSLTSY